MMEEAKGTQNLKTLRNLQSGIESKGRPSIAVSPKDLEGWKVPPGQLAQGDRVMVDNYGTSGILMEDPKNKKKVRVQLGNMVTVVEIEKIRGHINPENKQKGKKNDVTVLVESGSQTQTSCDLRGLRWEEAQNAMEAFVSQAIANKVGREKIIHGHGMGALKKMVRDFLETTGIGKFYPGSRGEGGDGVTIIEF